MALLKAFVCQVVLFGLYKLFLEQVVEEHLVPDELTRNCIVGFVCLLCFGIQLYTEKAGEEDDAEADENFKAKSESRGAKSSKKSEPSEISTTHETVVSNTSNRLTAHSGTFAQFSPTMYDTIPNVMKANGTGVPEVPASTLKTSYDPDKTAIPVLNGFSETKICEESDDDDIEIDQFVSRKSAEGVEQLKTVKTAEEGGLIIKGEDTTEETKHLRKDEDERIKPPYVIEMATWTTVEPKEVETIKAEDVTEETKHFRVDEEVEMIKSVDVTEESKQPRAGEEEVEAITPEEVTEASLVSECSIANGEVIEAEVMESEEVTEASLVSECLIADEDAVEAEEMKSEEVTEASLVSECSIANGEAVEVEVMESEDTTEKANQSREIEVEATKNEILTEARVESPIAVKPLADISSTHDLDTTSNLKIGESSGSQMTNGIAEESLKNSDNISSHINAEIESKKSVKDECEIGNGQGMTLSSEADEYMNDIKESSPSAQEMSSASLASTNTVNVDTTNKNNAKTSTLVIAAVSPPSEKLAISTARQKATVAADVCVVPVTIDISFIYACH